jgi:hypothetical protein
MNQENQKKLENSISNLKDKTARIYLFVQDTKGNAKASIRYIYQMGMALKNSGFNPVMLHEKEDYYGVSDWLGSEYMDLPHRKIEGEQLPVSPEDLLVIPEIYGFVMDQVKNLPCGKIVLCQSYDYMLETLQPGQNWSQFSFLKCITTSEIQKNYISQIMRNTSFDILKPFISDVFEKQEFPPKPIVCIHTREQRDSLTLIKTFYLKYPQYRWITFRDMRGLSEKEFANSLKDAYLSVWVDEKSGFGTYPLESMKVGVPVIGKLPYLKPEWLNDDNGIWFTDNNILVDMIADFTQNWLEDNIHPKVYESGNQTAEKYSNKEEFDNTVTNLFGGYFSERLFSFEEQLNKLETIEN